MENPFRFGTATFGEQFTDRGKDTLYLATNFRHGINTILISPRRWGKTSLVHKAAKTAQNNKLKIVTFDAFTCKSTEDFYTVFATEVIKQTSNKWEEWIENAKNYLSALVPKISVGADPINDFSISIDLSNKKISDEVLNLPQRIAKAKGIKIVICIDEFQQIMDFTDPIAFQKKLRSKWQLQTDVSYCLYGSKKHILASLFSKQSMPFYKFGNIFFLQKIAPKDWIKFICERFATTGKKISPQLAKKICETVDNHSSYVQQLAWIVWTKTTKTVKDKDTDSALDDLLNQNAPLFSKYIEELSSYQLNFLYAIACGVHSEFSTTENLRRYNFGTSANVTRLKSALENKELIDITENTIHFNDPVFLIWFKKNIKR